MMNQNKNWNAELKRKIKSPNQIMESKQRIEGEEKFRTFNDTRILIDGITYLKTNFFDKNVDRFFWHKDNFWESLLETKRMKLWLKISLIFSLMIYEKMETKDNETSVSFFDDLWEAGNGRKKKNEKNIHTRNNF